MKSLMKIGIFAFFCLSQAFAQTPTTPTISTPSFASMQFRLTADTAPHIDRLRASRDQALLDLNEHTVNEANPNPTNQRDGLGKLTKAINAIQEVCGVGASQIQMRLRKNSNSSFWWTVVAGITGTGTLAASAINATKGWSVATAASSYQSVATKEGDAAHNSGTLTKILEDVRKELASGATNYSKALLTQPQKSPENFALAKAAVFEMHNACAFF
ncbi:MAG: hypothetical protein QM533_04205 [Cytophagales bacterium]|nr:hypothetical protein [Cytophagales bacterium]